MKAEGSKQSEQRQQPIHAIPQLRSGLAPALQSAYVARVCAACSARATVPSCRRSRGSLRLRLQSRGSAREMAVVRWRMSSACGEVFDEGAHGLDTLRLRLCALQEHRVRVRVNNKA